MTDAQRFLVGVAVGTVGFFCTLGVLNFISVVIT